MGKILLISILLVIVYQFHEFVNMGLLILRKLLRHKYHYVIKNFDHYVGTALTIATMPLLLYSVLLSDNSLVIKLVWVAAIYLGFAVLSTGIGYFIKQLGHLKYQNGYNVVLSSVGLVGGLFHPGFNLLPWHAQRERMVFAKLAFLLSLPALAGILFKNYYVDYQFEFNQYLDVLIIVMVGGVAINIVVAFLEKFFRRSRLGIFSYFRIVAGMALALLLLYK